MSNVDQIRAVFDDNGFFTIDDSDFDALFLADCPAEPETSETDDLQELCIEFDLDFRRIDSDFVAIFWL